MTTFDLTSEKTQDYKDFWQDTQSKRLLKPEVVIANQHGTKLVAYATDDNEMLEAGFLIFFNDQKKVLVQTTRFLHVIESLSCLETSLDGRVFFVGGDFEDHGTLGAITFDSHLTAETFIAVGDGKTSCESVTEILRITGSDHLLVAGDKSLFAYSYESGSFKALRIFALPEAGFIVSMAVRKNFIFALDDQGKIFVRSVEKQLDTQALSTRGKRA